MKNTITFLTLLFVILFIHSCKKPCEPCPTAQIIQKKDTTQALSKAAIKTALLNKGFEVFDYVDEQTKDTIIMQKYFIAFLKAGPNRNQEATDLAQLQEQHLAHLTRMYELGFADLSGPFAENEMIKGITIYNTPTKKIADSLASLDPMVKAGRLQIEIHPWWAAKGYSLR